MAAECPSVSRSVAPDLEVAGQVIAGNQNWLPSEIIGVNASYLARHQSADGERRVLLRRRRPRRGQGMCARHDRRPRTCFKPSIASCTVRIQSIPLVLGVLEARGANLFGQDQDDIVLAPCTTII